MPSNCRPRRSGPGSTSSAWRRRRRRRAPCPAGMTWRGRAAHDGEGLASTPGNAHGRRPDRSRWRVLLRTRLAEVAVSSQWRQGQPRSGCGDFASGRRSRRRAARVDPLTSSEVASLKSRTYEEYLESEHWSRVRDFAKEASAGPCAICNAQGRLEIHHRTYATLGEGAARRCDRTLSGLSREVPRARRGGMRCSGSSFTASSHRTRRCNR